MAKLMEIYNRLLNSFGKQNWWPAETNLEIIIGAILTQQTAWKNVERAIENLRDADMLDMRVLRGVDPEQLERKIRITGFYRQKSKVIKNLVTFLLDEFDGDLEAMCALDGEELRELLLSVKGIGRETADSILLYMCKKPFFVVDAYTRRALRRLDIATEDDYESLRRFFESRLPKDHMLYGEFHALWVELGKRHCRRKPECGNCPLNDICPYPSKNE